MLSPVPRSRPPCPLAPLPPLVPWLSSLKSWVNRRWTLPARRVPQRESQHRANSALGSLRSGCRPLDGSTGLTGAGGCTRPRSGAAPFPFGTPRGCSSHRGDLCNKSCPPAWQASVPVVCRCLGGSLLRVESHAAHQAAVRCDEREGPGRLGCLTGGRLKCSDVSDSAFLVSCGYTPACTSLYKLVQTR